MNQIIQRLSEVETAASSIIEEAGAKKKQMAKDQDARIAAFEKQVHEETQKKISAQQAELEKKIAEELEAQKEELEKQLAHMDRIYEGKPFGDRQTVAGKDCGAITFMVSLVLCQKNLTKRGDYYFWYLILQRYQCKSPCHGRKALKEGAVRTAGILCECR